MTQASNQLKSIAKHLAALSTKVEKLSKQVDKGLTAKKTASKSTKAKPKAKPKVTKAAPVKRVKTVNVDKGETVLNSVFDVIKKSRKGISIAQLKEKTDLNPRQLSNALYKLTKKGSIKSMSRGIYTKA
jgi:predicted Rossmann fold nucleotide-binding protein DprA/Smf involved in DNA uptake